MYYVIQVAPGTEEITERWINKLVDAAVYGECFHPTRVMRKKLRGEWRELRSKLLPGYVFITSEDPKSLYLSLKKVPVLTKLLGHEGDVFSALTAAEEEWLRKVVAPEEGKTEVGVSKVSIGEDKEVIIVDGPLKNMTGMIVGYDLHRRFAEVEVSLAGVKTILHFGIELLKRKPEEPAS